MGHYLFPCDPFANQNLKHKTVPEERVVGRARPIKHQKTKLYSIIVTFSISFILKQIRMSLFNGTSLVRVP